MKRILLFGCDPGGSNTVIPLVKPLRKKGYDVRLYGKGVALERYHIANLKSNNINDTINEFKPENVENFIREEHPDFLITGTSAEDFTERYLWKACEHLNVPSFAILDQWVNYGIRFSPWGLSNCSQYEAAPNHPFIPSRIIVMDDFAKDEMNCLCGINRDRILPLGQPYFETILKQWEALLPVKDLRKNYEITRDEFIVTFVSEPLSHDYGETPDHGEFYGFTERTIFRHVRNAFLRIAERTGKKIHLIVKLHPRESSSNYDDLIDHILPGITISTIKSGLSMDLIHISNLVCGMSSMMLIEAAIVGKPIISVLIGLKKENPFVLDRRGVIRSVLSESDLDKSLNKAILEDSLTLNCFKFERNPVRSIIEEMERILE